MGEGRHRRGWRLLGRRGALVIAAALAVGAGAARAAVTSNGPVVAVSATDDTWAQQILPTADEVGSGYETRQQAVDGATSSSDVAIGCQSFPVEEGDLTLTADRSSLFVGPGVAITVDATVWQTADFAQADWDRTAPGIVSCFVDGLRASSSKTSKVKVLSVAAEPFVAVAPRTTAWIVRWQDDLTVKARVTVTVRVKKKGKKTQLKKKQKVIVKHVTVPEVSDLVLLGSGRASAILTFEATGKIGTSTALEQSIAGAMAARMASDPASPPQQ